MRMLRSEHPETAEHYQTNLGPVEFTGAKGETESPPSASTADQATPTTAQNCAEPTPTLYRHLIRSLAPQLRRHRSLGFMALLAAALLPTALERFAPQLGNAPGKLLASVLYVYVGLLGPWLAFRGELGRLGRPGGSARLPWARAVAGNAWLLVCLWLAVGVWVSRH